MKKILNRLFQHEYLTRQEAHDVLVNISKEQYKPEQIAAFLTVFQMRPIAVQELSGFRDALLELCLPIQFDTKETIDIVGTGGDGKNTFNISTISSFVVAGAGYKVTKHGNYGVSSTCGSSNVLEYLGYTFTNDTDELQRQLERANICFLHAPKFHPAMKAVAPVRRALGVKTFFNMLGPLVNPCKPKYNLLGVFNLHLSRLYQYILQQTDRRFSVVYALDGYDEVSLTGKTKVRTNEGEFVLNPSDFGKPKLQPTQLYGGDTVPEAAQIFTNILSGKGTTAQNEVVTTNAGLAIKCIKPNQSISDCIAEAQESLISQQALEKFKKLIN